MTVSQNNRMMSIVLALLMAFSPVQLLVAATVGTHGPGQSVAIASQKIDGHGHTMSSMRHMKQLMQVNESNCGDKAHQHHNCTSCTSCVACGAIASPVVSAIPVIVRPRNINHSSRIVYSAPSNPLLRPPIDRLV